MKNVKLHEEMWYGENWVWFTTYFILICVKSAELNVAID